MAECRLRQIVPNRWATIKRSFTKCFCVYTKGDKGSSVCLMRIVLLECKAEGDRTDNEGLFQRWN